MTNILWMNADQWNRVLDNPIQRDTVARADKVSKKHLRELSPEHAVVHAAMLPDGTLVKLDGHTRGLLWIQGLLESPQQICVIAYPVGSMDDAIELYKHFDSQVTTEGATDKLSGAYRLHNIRADTALMRLGGITSAFHIIDYRTNIYKAVGTWRAELNMLNELNASQAVMPSPLIAAAILTMAKHGRRALEFWRTYAAGQGTRVHGKSDGADELTRIVTDLRARKMLGTGGSTGRSHQAARAISCCEAWLQNRSYTNAARATDLIAYRDEIMRRDRPIMHVAT